MLKPDKWYIIPTEENKGQLIKWRNGGFSGGMDDTILRSDKVWYHRRPAYTDGYTEITFDQFKKWVLKEGDTPKCPGYVQVVGHTTMKLIYPKARNEEKDKFWFIDTLGTSGEYLVIDDTNINVQKHEKPL